MLHYPPIEAFMFTVCLWNWKVRSEAPVRKWYLSGGSLGSLPGVRSVEASRGEGSRLRHDARDWLESSCETVIANQGEKSPCIITSFNFLYFLEIKGLFCLYKQNVVLFRVVTCPMWKSGSWSKTRWEPLFMPKWLYVQALQYLLLLQKKKMPWQISSMTSAEFICLEALPVVHVNV